MNPAQAQFPCRSAVTTLLILFSLIISASVSSSADLSSLREALTFHASFDQSPDADFALGDRRIFTALSIKEPRNATPGLPTNGVVSIAKGEGHVGDALRFHRRAPEMVHYQAAKNLAYATSNWNGTVSFWLRLDPDADLEPGYCDPLQITPRAWNDGALWVDFSKDERPRHFRLGVFADRAVWDPTGRDLDKTPETERPLVTLTRPPFSRDQWTHVVFTFANFNTGKKDGAAVLYLDGQSVGRVSAREQTFTWNPAQAIALLGIGYTGLFDELAFFNRALTPAEVGQLFALPKGVAEFRP
jgi:hypothetical protein